MSRKPDIVERLLRFTGNNTDWPTISEAAAEIERLRRDYSSICNEMRRMMDERDEARREVCQKHDHGYFTDEDYAEIRGWDCFKENNQ